VRSFDWGYGVKALCTVLIVVLVYYRIVLFDLRRMKFMIWLAILVEDLSVLICGFAFKALEYRNLGHITTLLGSSVASKAAFLLGIDYRTFFGAKLLLLARAAVYLLVLDYDHFLLIWHH